MVNVIKRDGRLKSFDKSKILGAIHSAFIAVDGSLSPECMLLSEKIANSIELKVNSQGESLSVEDIQDMVVNGLMESNRKDVAVRYIIYRNDRTRERERKSKFREAVREKVYADNIQNQNANVDENSFGGRRGEADFVLLKLMALDELVSDTAKRNHENNEVYLHDLDSYVLGMHNCLTIPFDYLLRDGFNTRQTDIRSAGSINTAMQLIAVIFQIQSLQQFGGVSAAHIDESLVPYVRKSFYKHYKNGLKYLLSDEDYEEIKRQFVKESGVEV